MDNTEKLRVILQHWIDHNGGHVAEFEKWQTIMKEEGKNTVASSIGDAITQMDKVSEILADILTDCGGSKESTGHHHHHDHHHD